MASSHICRSPGFSNSNTTSGASSLSVPYGGSKTVTVAPSDGYYLSGVTCPTGYTCSGYNTGSSYTGQQTVTVANNSSASTVTLGFTGAIVMTNAEPGRNQPM